MQSLAILPSPRTPDGTPSGRPWSPGSRSVSAAACSGAAARDPRATAGAAHPEPCVEANYPQRTRFECIAERKLRRRQLTEDGNVEISGRDLRERSR
jgi:hypothetical protein